MRRFVKSPVIASTVSNYKQYWAYKEVVKNWKSDVVTHGSVTTITIWYDKKANDVYAKFQIKDLEDGFGIYYIDDDGDRHFINDEVDFCGTLDECIQSCFYYFHTRF